MKTLVKAFVLCFVFISASVLFSNHTKAQNVSVSFQVFYDELSPYGYWVNDPSYGYVWIPDAGPGFTPYATNGHWVFTDVGWTWVSNYPWGWAPFHYGRWNYNPSYGYIWVPDTQWGPAWVVWRSYGGYYGWAPMPWGVSVNMAFGNSYSIPNDQWRFVRDRDLNRPDINNYYIDRSRNVTIIQNSTVIQNVYTDKHRRETYISGPKRQDVQRAVGSEIKSVSLKENNRPGQKFNNGELAIYRPRIEKSAGGGKAAPSKVTDRKDVKAPSQKREPVIQKEKGKQKEGIKPVQRENVKPKEEMKQGNRQENVRPKPNRDIQPSDKKEMQAPVGKPKNNQMQDGKNHRTEPSSPPVNRRENIKNEPQQPPQKTREAPQSHQSAPEKQRTQTTPERVKQNNPPQQNQVRPQKPGREVLPQRKDDRQSAPQKIDRNPQEQHGKQKGR